MSVKRVAIDLDNAWDAIVLGMNDDVREQVHGELAPCSNEDFLRRYCELDVDFADHLLDEFDIDVSDMTAGEYSVYADKRALAKLYGIGEEE